MGRCYGHGGPGEPCRLLQVVHKPLLQEPAEVDRPGGEERKQMIVKPIKHINLSSIAHKKEHQERTSIF